MIIEEAVGAINKALQVVIGLVVEWLPFPAKAKQEVIERDPRKGVPVRETEGGKLYAILESNMCPDCNSTKGFVEGPSGGLSTNIFCASCGAGFNVTPIIGTADRIGTRRRAT